MNPIAIFYHIRTSGNGVDFDHATSIVQEQFRDVDKSGLLSAATEFYVGVNGGDADTCAVSMMAPEKANIIENPMEGCGELPTLFNLQQWLPTHEDWHVLYFHTKGALHHGGTKLTWASWRHCMANVVIWNWQMCVKDLNEGFDCAGAHWMTREKYPNIVGTPYFGGNFWWATAKYLSTLPTLSPFGPNRYEAEAWIGRSRRKVFARGYRDHFPGAACAT